MKTSSTISRTARHAMFARTILLDESVYVIQGFDERKGSGLSKQEIAMCAGAGRIAILALSFE